MSRLKTAIFVFFFVKGALGACPDGWFQNGPKCYYYSGNDAINLPWHEADSKCKAMAGGLVVIEDAVENNLVYNQLGVNVGAWIGLHDLNQEDSWQWVDGSDLSYAAWAPDQPDNWQDASASQEDCVEILQNNGGLWNDASCNLPHYFVCERDENAVPSPNCQESSGWEEFEGRCYVIVESKITWIEAESACKAAQANLVAIGTQTEQLYVANAVNEWNQHIWMGLSTVGHDDHQLYWSNGDEYTLGVSYDNWLDGQPAIDPNADSCGEIDPSASYEGPWSVDVCGEGHAYMCERGYTGTCADGWRMYDGNCYWFAMAEGTWENWIAANATCETMGAKLLKIDNDDLEKYITVHLADFQDAGALGIWLGFSDKDEDGVFMWTDGQRVDGGYKIFGPNQPRDQPSAYDCGQIFTGSSSGVWETDDCFKKQGYVCQIPTGQDPAPLDPPASISQGCDPGWVGFGSHCYFFERSKEASWDQAEQDCAGYGGHIASVVSAEENAFVTGHVSTSVWLGGNDLATDNKWIWVDDSPWAFQDWYSGEPNCGQCCVQIWFDANRKWDDTPCTSAKPYVCKKQKLDCWEPLGMEDGRILDTEITASSIYGPGSEATEARLNNINDGTAVGAWSPQLVYADCPAIPTDQRVDCGGGGREPCLSRGCCFDDSIPNVNWCFYLGTVPPAGSEWLQVKLVPERTVAGVATQGRPSDVNEYVTSYQVAYSTDGSNFQFVKGRSGSTQTFTGNSDTNTVVANKFYAPVLASYIRIYPYDYNLYPTMRVELMGCTIDGGDLATPSPDEVCTSVNPTERLDCGYPGITPAECVSKGCCWDNSISGTKWCFYGKDQYDPRCGKDWQFDPHGEVYCYHFNDYSLRTWQQARDYCIGMGGDLLSVNSKAEQSYVSGQMVTLVMTHALWIGANRVDANSGWTWSNGQPFNYINWEDGEPNGADSNEHCVEAYTSNSKWNDINCANERGMVCKKFANIVSPIPIDQNEYAINVCEGETYTLVCPGLQIVVHHASYGRSNIITCGEGGGVPAEGCHSEDSLDIVSQMCNNRESCVLTASNEIFGDPCNGIYKYLNVIYSCEEKTCFGALGVENGSIPDAQISQSTYLDNQHRGIDGRLNGPRSWATKEKAGAYIQVTFPNNIRVTGVIIQGANDAERYVTSFTVAFANDNTYQQWTDYTDFDKVLMNFTGNTDQQTPVRAVLAEHVFTSGIRIQPQTWVGDMIGLRMEITGCNPLRELACSELGDVIWAADEANDVTMVQAECPGLCPLSTGVPAVYGTDIYSGSSEVCNAAVHAGVILDRFGGPVTILKKPAQAAYRGSVKNGITSFDLDYYPVAFAFGGNEETCQIGWKPYSSFCYYFGDEKLPWAEAEAKCVEMGGHLASIRDSVEQDFLAQQIILLDFQYWWIGLNELRSLNEYEWVDGEPVLYTNWGAASPDNYGGKMENCVEMCVETQRWDDYLCDDISGYICKKYKAFYSADETVAPTPPAGCPDGWSAYEGTCYFFRRELVAEEDSEAFCEGLGGYNVHIQNKYVQSFIHTMIGSEDWRWWLGLHAQVSTDTGVAWQWESGDPVTYDNWGIGNPDIDVGECSVFYGGQFGNGMWYSHRCEKTAYSICERPRDGWTEPPITTPAPTGGCAWDWSTPSESSGFCYKVFAPEAAGEWDRKQSWENAMHQCLNNGGDLVSIHSKEDEVYLIDQLSQLGIVSTSVWIGLNDRDKVGWSWSDDTPVEYLSWNFGSPSLAEDNNCVAMKYEPATGTGFWDNLNCHQTLDWICRRPKGIAVVVPTDPPTGKPNAACGSQSDGTWIEYEGMCYLFNDALPVDVHTAQRTCQTTGGELASVHTIAESAFITNQIKQMPGVSRFWIGLRETGGYNSQYVWTDGTPVDFVNWSEGEPNDAVGIEQCVTTLQDTGRWNDDNCGLELSGFVCKKYLGAPPNPPGPTQAWPGGCPANWLMYSNYCYQVHGEARLCDPAVTDNPECAADWRGAVEYCKQAGGALASIHDKYENAFITAQTIRAYHNLWIGISDTQWGLYSWANGDEVTYTNWNTGEPNHHNGEENCGELYHEEALAGRWNDKNCDSVGPFICSMGKDPQISQGLELNNNAKCPDNWVQYDMLDGHYACYYLDNTPRTFDDAQQNCRNMNSESDLMSFQTMFDQNFMTSYLRGQSVWLGMKQNPDTQDWVWVDGWPVWISNWGENQPTSDTSKACVINVDSVFGSEWLTADCSQVYPSVCKTSTEEIPPTPGTVEGDCPDNTWHEYGGFCCKAFVTLNGQNDVRNWADAEAQCTTYGGHLASFASRHELEWFLTWYNETETLWIGLRSNGQGGWSWIDGRPLSFTYWNEGEPNNAHEDNEDCVEMYGGSGKWNDISCTDQHGYVCLTPKALGTDENGNVIFYTTPKPEPPTEHKENNSGVIAGVVLGILFALILIGGAGFYLYRNRDTASKIADTASEIPTGIVNKLYTLSGNTPEEKPSDETPPVRFDKESGATVDDSNA